MIAYLESFAIKVNIISKWEGEHASSKDGQKTCPNNAQIWNYTSLTLLVLTKLAKINNLSFLAV